MMANPFDQFDAPAAKPASLFDNALAAEGASGHVADIARSIYQQESASGKNPRTSNAGAVGGMQVIPATFDRMADQGWDINNPEHNARAGIRYVKTLYDRAGGDPALTAAGYYGGEGAIDKARNGVAVSDPRNPNAPNTLQYGQQVASRVPAQQNPFDQFDAPAQSATPAPKAAADAVPNPFQAPSEQTASSAPAKPGGLSMTTDINGNPLPQRTVSFLHGLMDPVAGASQLITKVLPDSVNQAMTTATNKIADLTGFTPRMPEGGIDGEIKKREAEYQQLRQQNEPNTLSSLITGQKPDPGMDGYRILGNVASPVNLVPAARVPQAITLPGKIGIGAGTGAAYGALNPVTSDDFAGEKIKQVGMGAAFGAATPVVAGAIARLISPNASTNANVQLLKEEGIRPTIGQTLGGWANATEEKAQSIPILGDMIARARGQAREQFNNAAINRATSPIGVKVNGSGQEAITEAGDALSNAYNGLLSRMSFRPDPQFHTELSNLTQLASTGLAPKEAAKFNALLNEHLSKLSPNGSMTGETFKVLESKLGAEAKKFSGSTDAYQKELGDALSEALNVFRSTLARSNPAQAQQLRDINTGWANLVRVEGAGTKALNSEGVFTPGQLNQAVRGADGSVRDRATARGQALMQDLSNAGQQVLGNRVPDSGTAGRALLAGLGLGSGYFNPAIPAALVAGGLTYTGPVQSILRAAASSRPQVAQPAAEAVRNAWPALLPLTTGLGLGLAKE